MIYEINAHKIFQKKMNELSRKQRDLWSVNLGKPKRAKTAWVER